MDKNDFFDEICLQYYERILKYCYLSLGEVEAAKDITQEVFIVCFKKLDKLKQHPNIGGFLFKCAQNLIKGKKRDAYRQIMREISAEDKIELIADEKNDVFNMLDKKINEYDYIYEIIDKLSEDKKMLYEMYYINKKTMSEIAQIIGIDYTALRMRFVRLRKEIKENVKMLAEEKF